MGPTPTPSELVDRRAELLSRPAGDPGRDAELASLTDELRGVLAGDARLRRLRLHSGGGPDDLARRLAALEPVNPVRDEADLADRFDVDRRVFVLEHDRLPGRPLNVVWVALCRGVPDRLGEVLDPGAARLDPAEADTAVFYSIWNAEPGLVGLGRGGGLIGAATEELRGELPDLRTFVTLSPVPGFRRTAERDGSADGSEAAEELAAACARYLTTTRRGRLLDPVARFHMGNGARLWRICPDADPSPSGMSRSWGVMANYRYEPEDREANRRSLVVGSPAIGEQVAALLAP